ncbi:hypothetical protein PMAYCL1PPCAC_18594 [Pristionchus mayeri]|uniref:Uncharacterized protein n=1 Tax=Pristionchus mayeri TaxID=1317129 RepID=A0AAN5CQ67_9BILA|nr:hypothetical protein PMAYCL1PPCAC_18594 [Pristionchus mayeri]
MSETEALFICVAPGRFYGGREYPTDLKYENRNRTEPSIAPGDWVNLKLRLQNGVQTVLSASKSEPALTTIKHEGKVYLDVRVVFSKNDLYSEDMDDYIYVPQIADVDEFEFDITYALLVTWMDPHERNCCSTKTGSGSKARWKLAVNKNADGSIVGLPKSQMGYSFVSLKPTMTLMGLIVGQQDSNDRRRFYVWCPGCPLHYDGIVVEDPKCLLKIGKFILFKIDRREYNDVFVHREARHFYILCYEGVEKPPCEVFVTNVNGDERRSKSIIKMMVVDFTRDSKEMQRVNDGGTTGFIFTHNKILISDDKGMLHKVPDGHMCNLMLIRQKPTEPWMTQWRVHEVLSIRRAPPKRVVRPSAVKAVTAPNGTSTNGVNGATEAMNRLSVDTGDRPAPSQVARSKSVELDGAMESEIEAAPLPPSSPVVAPALSIPSTPSNAPSVAPSQGQFDDLDTDEHIAFVEAYCPRNDAVYLWIVDDPQQAVIWGCKGKRKPQVGSFLRGYFKQQADGRLYCNMEDYLACGAPTNIKVFDRSGHAIVRTDVLSEKNAKGEMMWRSNYLGLVEDVQRHMPRNVLDREKFSVQIGKRKQDKDFVWTIEMDVSKEQTHGSPSNGSASRATRKSSAPLRSPPSRGSVASGNGTNGGLLYGMNGGSTLDGNSPASSLNVTVEELSLPHRHDCTSTDTVTPPAPLDSPGFESRKTSIDDQNYSRPPSRASAGTELNECRHEDDPPITRYYPVNDEEWTEDTRQAREEPDPEMELIETFANGFTGLFGDNHVLDLFSYHMDPAQFHQLMYLSNKF